MKQWYAKELAKLAQVSVRTLHHYDKIGLLKPGLRQSNNYRLYSETDLLRLQQIIALKFFGFELSQIKALLARNDTLPDRLAMQSRFLREKAASLLDASAILDSLSLDCIPDKSIPWQKIIELIGVYNMTQQLEDAWVKEIFTPDEMKDYVKFETALKEHSTPESKEAFETTWFNLVDAIKNCLHENPASERGIALGKQLMDWVNSLYGPQYAHLRTKKFERGFGEGKGLEHHGLTPETVTWMEKAMNAYLRQRAHIVLDNVGKIPESRLTQEWTSLMDEAYGQQVEKKVQAAALLLEENTISEAAKEWLKAFYHL
ncbi:MerR family transcriptional regulator [Legionella geestiana]|uniref:MerR family transcriptional regulator n=1 Tax=Legionella geestiana TaxID=45065 RepID=UPI001091D070|nr:MerR family transcriptional regulator [Legionella geestiana]QDQ38962.1 MerR family transcriptional regulator [Legionella geestiana]